MLENFRETMEFEVPYGDVDMMQHVNHAKYLVWAETLRCRLFDDLLNARDRGPQGIILLKMELTYEAQLRWRDRVAAGVRFGRLGNKSFTLDYEVWDVARNIRACRGMTTQVAYDYVHERSIVIPDAWRKIIRASEPWVQES